MPLFAWDITEVAHKGMNVINVIVVSLLRLKLARERGSRLKVKWCSILSAASVSR